MNAKKNPFSPEPLRCFSAISLTPVSPYQHNILKPFNVPVWSLKVACYYTFITCDTAPSVWLENTPTAIANHPPVSTHSSTPSSTAKRDGSSYIAKILPGTREVEVDHLWTNLLAYYFPTTQTYGVEREAYIRSRSQTRANVCVSTLSDGKMFNVIIVEKKKASTSRSAHPTPGSWTHAEGQLLGYMLSRRDNQEKDLRRLFGIVGIGRWCDLPLG
ncbi:unnamed protein product [Penicillium roqueforti FM164]|uniref:Genomic scaffold, ProqFM164S02 n=1 Tax=Penicillium roqueforti (strain FM164) TaxID=1365484 RepID=W6Q6W1_PENRF|nr:unnamed protein product [Penicillium roqueforti FM164]